MIWTYGSASRSSRPEDPYGNQVVAVTGRIDPDSVAATVVSRKTSVQHSVDARGTPVEVDAITLLEGADVIKILGRLGNVSWVDLFMSLVSGKADVREGM